MKTTLLFFLFFTVIGNLQAQEKPSLSADSLAVRQSRALVKPLSLSAAQTSQIVIIMKQQATQSQALTTTLLSATERSDKIKQLAESQRQALKEVLTPEQWQRYEALIQEGKAAFLKHTQEKNIPVKEGNENPN